MQLGPRVPKEHVHDSAAVDSKGRTRLTSAGTIGKAGVTCQHATTVQRQPPQAIDRT
jgi:hypothetical protein